MNMKNQQLNQIYIYEKIYTKRGKLENVCPWRYFSLFKKLFIFIRTLTSLLVFKVDS